MQLTRGQNKMKRILLAITLTAAAVTGAHADQPLSMVSKDGRLFVTAFGNAVKYKLDRKAEVVCNGQNFTQEGIDNFGATYKSYAQVCQNGTGVFIKHFLENGEVQVAVTDGMFKETVYRNVMLQGRGM